MQPNTPDEAARLELFTQFVKSKFSSKERPFTMNRKRVSDAIFTTIENVRSEFASIAMGDTNGWLNGNFVVQSDEGGERKDVLIPRISALTLAVAARVALDWDIIHDRADEATRDLMVDLLEKANLARSTDEIVNAAPHMAGVLRAMVPDVLETREEGAVIPMRDGLADEVLRSEGAFNVEQLPPDNDVEQTYIIVADTIRRYHELLGDERRRLKEQVRRAEKWTPFVKEATMQHVPDMLALYEGVRIEREDLVNLVSDRPSVKQAALLKMASSGQWFLEDPDENALRDMIANGTASVLYDERGESVIGYCGAITSTDRVKSYLHEQYGYKVGKKYANIRELPTEAFPHGHHGLRTSVHWSNPYVALDLLNNVDTLAVSVEIAVSDAHELGMESRRSKGAASALKLDNYRRLLLQGKKKIILRHLEILQVNGIPVPSAVNRPGRMFIELLDGNPIGSHTEYARRSDGVEVLALWHDFVADLAKAIGVIEAKVA